MDTDCFLERSKGAKEDASKWTLIFPKIILQGLSLWPEVQTKPAKFFSACLLVNVGFMLFFHTAYFIENIRDIIKMAELLTTVNISLQSFVRIATMLYYSKKLQILLSKIWTNFWPSSILEPSEHKKIRKLTVRYFSFVMMFGIAATCTTLQFMYQPLILGMRTLPLMLKLPFDFSSSPTFEILYVWNAITCMTIQFSVLGFDFFFTMLTWNCAIQFKILKNALERLVVDTNNTTKDMIVGSSAKTTKEQTEKLRKCILHHTQLIDICDDMEDMFRYILLIQLLDSALALCVCCFAAVAVPSLFAKMMTFVVMYLMQLFLYCAFGNELYHQSTRLAYAAFTCGWHYSGNVEMQKLLVMLMQKSQKGQVLTARGFAVVDYTSCLKVLRMAFSFYTLLDKMKTKLK